MPDPKIRLSPIVSSVLIIVFSIYFSGCSASAESTAKSNAEPGTSSEKSEKPELSDAAKAEIERNRGALIRIKEDSAADTVRVFYKRLREKKFRDAMMMTNLSPAVKGLTDNEMKDLGVDFGFLAQNVPESMPINGEIVTGKTATVTVQLPNEETNKPEVQEIKLRKDESVWLILVADEEGEKAAKKEGKNYFFSLRMDVHHKEAKAMLDRIGKAQMIYSMKNGGKFTDLDTLINNGFVPQDAKNAVSTGYNYNVSLGLGGATYSAFATPAEYGKTGKLSFALKITKEAQPELISKDLKGRSIQN
ncbi:MAG: hypothetical protein KDB79_06675 [Acidobacteria bacterium]|nr:hypothetical protein [Acidobacteriota bacterium]